MVAGVVIQAALIALFLVLGILLFRGKGAFLIAGYNTASPQEKAQYNEKALCRCVGVMMFACAGCFALILLGNLLERNALVWIGILLMLTAIVVGAIYANTSKRVKRK